MMGPGDITIKTPYAGWPSAEAERIFRELLPRWTELFLTKNAEYQDDMGSADVTGLPGQFCDIYRKVMKLRKPMLDGASSLTTESLEEVLLDMIGHCFLAIDMARRLGVTGLAVQEGADDGSGRR